MSEKKTITGTLKRLISFLSLSGKIVIIAASDDLYKGNWLSLGTDYEKNINAGSGDCVRIFLKDYGVELVDYLWKESDCECFFDECGLSVVEKIKPLGLDQDGKKWADELRKSPFVIYVLSRI